MISHSTTVECDGCKRPGKRNPNVDYSIVVQGTRGYIANPILGRDLEHEECSSFQ